MVTHTLQTERRRTIRSKKLVKKRNKASRKNAEKSPTRKILKKLSAAKKTSKK